MGFAMDLGRAMFYYLYRIKQYYKYYGVEI